MLRRRQYMLIGSGREMRSLPYVFVIAVRLGNAIRHCRFAVKAE